MKKTTKKAKPAAKPAAAKRSVAPAAPAPVPPAATTTAAPPPAPVVKPRPLARMHKKTAAQKLGSELVRYLRIHAKKPYGTRGVKAILVLAERVRVAAEQEASTLAAACGHHWSFAEAALAQLQPQVTTPSEK